MEPIHVTKTFLPPFDEYCELLRQVWAAHTVTNDGPLYQQFERDLRAYTKVDHLACVVNGMLGLHIAVRALNVVGRDVITTPFTHVGTSGSLVWEQCNPVYADIDANTLNMDPGQIEAKITARTAAILPVHVYGNPCDVERIESIAQEHGLKVIYDAAHAFGAKYKGRSLLGYGDLSVTSFHATKGMHTVEGGALFARDAETISQVRKLAYFGIDERKRIAQTWGTNAKMNELCAAMGIVNLRYFPDAIRTRRRLYEKYVSLLAENPSIRFQRLTGEISYSYMPVIVRSEGCKHAIIDELNRCNIFPREYFSPSLETVFKGTTECPVAYDLSRRVLCLPLSAYLTMGQVERICHIIDTACASHRRVARTRPMEAP